MTASTREQITKVLKFYQDTQVGGRKDVEQQIQIYTDDSVFISFPVAGILGSNEIRVLNNKQEIEQAFDGYNQYISNFDKVTIEYQDMMVDAEKLRGSFIMAITTEQNGVIKHYRNYLQMQFNEKMKITRSLNWQAELDADVELP